MKGEKLKLLVSLTIAFTMLASPVYALNNDCIPVGRFIDQNPQIEYDNWKHIYTIVPDRTNPHITLEMFDPDPKDDVKVVIGGFFIDGCYVEQPWNTISVTYDEVESLLSFLI